MPQLLLARHCPSGSRKGLVLLPNWGSVKGLWQLCARHTWESTSQSHAGTGLASKQGHSAHLGFFLWAHQFRPAQPISLHPLLPRAPPQGGADACTARKAGRGAEAWARRSQHCVGNPAPSVVSGGTWAPFSVPSGLSFFVCKRGNGALLRAAVSTR